MSPGIVFYNCEKGPPKFSLWHQFAVDDKFETFLGDMSPGNIAGESSVHKKADLAHHHLLSPPPLDTTTTTTTIRHDHHYSTRPELFKTQFDLHPHMESNRWPQIYAGIQQHLQKIYNGKKAALKERYWVPEEDGSYDLERIRRGRPSHISEADWDAQLAFWSDPKNLMETSAIREYPSLIHTFFLTHTVSGIFLNPEDKALYDEMLRL
nr:hypothetical protein [Tanacetum cinerariifolium]